MSQELFTFFATNFGLTLLESEMDDIERAVRGPTEEALESQRKLIEEARATSALLLTANAELQKNGARRWVPVGEAMPPDEMTVLIFNTNWPGDSVTVGYHHETRGWLCSNQYVHALPDGVAPTHWMVMPGTKFGNEAQSEGELALGNGKDYRRICFLIGSIFYYGGFKAETASERELEGLLRKHGYFFTTEPQLLLVMGGQKEVVE